MRSPYVPACLLLLAAGAAEAAPATMRLASHRAVYDLTLAESRGARAVEGARGRIVIDFGGDACKGYTMQTRQVTEIDSGETGTRTSDLRNTTFESGDGHSFRFKTNTILNGTPSPAVDGTAETTAEALKVRLKEPKRDQYQEASPVLFPTVHMRRLIQAAQAGETTVSVKVFDGSDDGRKIYDTLAVIGRQSGTTAPAKGDETDAAKADAPSKTEAPKADSKPDRDRPLKGGEMAAVPHWPVTLSYFTAGQGERTPVYVLTFDLYENGVSGALRLDYGDFSIDGNLSRLDLNKPQGECAP